MLLYHLPYPAGAVKSLKAVAVSLVFELLPVKIPLRKVRQPCDLGIGSIANVTDEILHFEHEIHLAL